MVAQCYTSQSTGPSKICCEEKILCTYKQHIAQCSTSQHTEGQKQMRSFTDTEIAVSTFWTCATSNERKQHIAFRFVFEFVFVFVFKTVYEFVFIFVFLHAGHVQHPMSINNTLEAA